MGRILFWVLLGLAVYALWRWFAIKQRARARTQERSSTGEAMVSCDVCRLNVPQSEALSANGRWYCCDEHRRRASD
ncbi:MAG TPA: PP0621 family protein [Burkholderiaceae bacterium]|jgi:uncharacterized protein|nr:PP0621 family protein [Burkholderiaceae bacterium]